MQSGQPRSSSTADAPISSTIMEITCAAAAACLPREEGTAEWIKWLEVSSLTQTSSAVVSSTNDSIHTDSMDGTTDPQWKKKILLLFTCSRRSWCSHNRSRLHSLGWQHCWVLEACQQLGQVVGWLNQAGLREEPEICPNHPPGTKEAWALPQDAVRGGVEWDPPATKGCL